MALLSPLTTKYASEVTTWQSINSFQQIYHRRWWTVTKIPGLNVWSPMVFMVGRCTWKLHSIYSPSPCENSGFQWFDGIRGNKEKSEARRGEIQWRTRTNFPFSPPPPLPLHPPLLNSSKNGPPSTTKDGTISSPVNPKEGLILRPMRRHTEPSLF